MTMKIALPQYEAAAALEQSLGDPMDPDAVLGFRQATAHDETSEYSQAADALLASHRFQDWYVPSRLGGRLRSFEEMIAVSRAVFRRDATIGFAYGATTLMGAVSVWVAGDSGQQSRLADRIMGGMKVSVAFHEAAHGNDMLSYDVRATPEARGWRLDGEKWLINNATASGALVVFARTADIGGPRGFSLFLVEKSRLADHSFTCLPKIRTHGLRGADVSGIRFEAAQLEADAVVGSPGKAMEIALKAFQITRAVLPGMSLGAVETALSTTMDFATSRRLYGGGVFAIPHARHLLAGAFADLMMCDSLSVVASRSLHVTPDQMSVHSAIVKYLLPTMAERIINDAATVLGARHYLREQHCYGIFEKILRDYPLVGLGHAGKFLCLQTIAAQLPHLAKQVGEKLHDGNTCQQADQHLPARQPQEEQARREGIAADRVDIRHPHRQQREYAPGASRRRGRRQIMIVKPRIGALDGQSRRAVAVR